MFEYNAASDLVKEIEFEEAEGVWRIFFLLLLFDCVVLGANSGRSSCQSCSLLGVGQVLIFPCFCLLPLSV